MLITFSGLDGSGKSTLVEWLTATLQADKRRVVVLHLNNHVGLRAYARMLFDGSPPPVGPRSAVHGRGAPGLRGVLRRMRIAITWSRWLREIVYPFDLLIFLGYRLYIETLRKRILIMDRYFYDSLADMADGRRWASLRLLQALTPTPDVAFLLDVPPELADRRKSEQPLGFLKRRWQAYNTLFPSVRTSVILSNRDLDSAKATVYGAVSERLPAP